MNINSSVLVGALFLVSGAVMLLTLPGYQRKVESGKIERDPSRPSFKTLRFAAIGILVVGAVLIASSFLNGP